MMSADLRHLHKVHTRNRRHRSHLGWNAGRGRTAPNLWRKASSASASLIDGPTSTVKSKHIKRQAKPLSGMAREAQA